MFASRVLKVISEKFRSDPSLPARSFTDSAGKKLVALGIAGVTASVTASYMMIHRVLETRKFVDIEKMDIYIPQDRNIFGHGAEMDTSQTAQVAKDALTVMVQIRESVEPSTDPADRYRFNKEASAERRTLLSNWLFGSNEEESTRIVLDVLPYVFSPLEISLLKRAAAAKKKQQ